MLSPSTRQVLQEKIDALIERAKDDPALEAQVNEALAEAQRYNDAAIASRRPTGGLVSAQYQALLNRGLL
jgi:hypothetical protein